MGLTKLAIQRPVFMLMLMIASILLGTIAARSMRLEESPDVAFGVITISTPYPGADPDTIAELVSRPLEEAVSGIEGLREVTSTSQEGFSVVVVQLEIGSDVDVALNEVRSRVDANIAELPRDVEQPVISKLDTSSEPVLFLALSSESLSSLQLRDLADNVFKDRFARVKGVAQASVTGGDQREIQIQLDKDRLMAYGLGVNDVLQGVQGSTINVPAGRIVQGDSEVSVRVPAEFRTVEEVQSATISLQDRNGNEPPRVVRLSDIATITDTAVERRAYSRLGGQDTVAMVLQKTKQGNAIEIARGVRALIPQLEREYPVKFTITQDVSERVFESIKDLAIAILFGIFLVAAVVYIFLHNFRGTLIVAIAIPLCIFITFIFMRWFGFTLNNLSLLALSLAVGVLVDDAIVVLENIYRHLKMGEDPREAAINGRSEIGLAAIAITLVDVVVFLPIGFLPGIVGQFFKPLALSFAACVLLSLFVSFTITPMLASRWYRKGEDVEHPQGRFAVWFERNWSRLERVYRRMLEWSLAHRWFVFISGNVVLVGLFVAIAGSFQKDAGSAFRLGMPLVVAALVVGVIVMVINAFRRRFKPQILLYALLFGLTFPLAAFSGFAYVKYYKNEPAFKFAFLPPTDTGSISIELEMPAGSSLEATQRTIDRVERIAIDHPETRYVLTNVGFLGSAGFGGGGDRGSQFAQIQVSLHPKRAYLDRLYQVLGISKERLRDTPDTAVAAELLERIGRVPGAEIKVSVSDAQGFGAPIQMSFVSNDREKLVATVTRLREELDRGAIPGVINPDLSAKEGKPELQLIPNRERLSDAGLSPADFAQTMRVLYEGNDDAKFRVGGREYPIRVMLDLEDRNNPETLSQIPVSFSQGRPVFLPDLASTREAVGVDKVNRRDRIEEIQLTANLLPGFAAGSVQSEIDAFIRDQNLVPEGVTFRPLGQADAQAREVGALFVALILGLVLVYMVLASLYENLLYPFIIQLSQPQALVGAMLALILTDRTLNIVGFIGIICLVGLVGKNAILLVDYTNTLRERGRNRHDALVEAGPVRLRPIMMTTLALIGGMLPVALAIGRGSEFRETIGIVIIGGMTVSTLLTLLVIPCSYTIFDDLSNWMSRLRGKRGHFDDGAPPSETPGGAEPVPQPSQA